MPCCCNTLHLLLKESMASCPPWKSLSAPYFSLVMPVHSPEQHPQLKDLKCIHTKDFFFSLQKWCSCWTLCLHYNSVQPKLITQAHLSRHPPSKMVGCKFQIWKLRLPQSTATLLVQVTLVKWKEKIALFAFALKLSKETDQVNNKNEINRANKNPLPNLKARHENSQWFEGYKCSTP